MVDEIATTFLPIHPPSVWVTVTTYLNAFEFSKNVRIAWIPLFDARHSFLTVV